MNGDRAQHRFHKGKASGLVHEVRLPGGELASGFVDEGLQLCSGWASKGEWDVRIMIILNQAKLVCYTLR